MLIESSETVPEFHYAVSVSPNWNREPSRGSIFAGMAILFYHALLKRRYDFCTLSAEQGKNRRRGGAVVKFSSTFDETDEGGYLL